MKTSSRLLTRWGAVLITWLVVLGVSACAPVTAVQPAASAPSEPIKLTVWQVPNHPQMQSIVEGLVKDYEKEHNVDVEVVIIPWGDLDTMWASAIESGETP